jgi:hypothetical protein
MAEDFATRADKSEEHNTAPTILTSTHAVSQRANRALKAIVARRPPDWHINQTLAADPGATSHAT